MPSSLVVCSVAVVLIVSRAALVASDAARYSSGHEANTAALESANAGRYEEALHLFRAAVDLAPSNPDYICNLGVTFMRMGKYPDARKAFTDALAVRPGHSLALDNLQQLQRFDGIAYRGPHATLTIPKAVIPPLSAIRHKVQPLPRVPLNRIHEPQFAQYLNGSRAYKLVNFTSLTPSAYSRNWPFEYFREHFGNRAVSFYPYNLPRTNTGPQFVPLRESLDEIEQPSGRFSLDPAFPGSYALWNMNNMDWKEVRDTLGGFPQFYNSDDAWLHDCFGNDDGITQYIQAAHWRMVLFGNKGAGMFNHQDTLRTASFHLTLQGVKRWHICPPSQHDKMYGAAEVYSFAPDYDRFPKFLEAECFLDDIEPGEIVYYPLDYWHQTLTISERSISITGTLVDAHCFKAVGEELEKKCKQSGGGYPDTVCQRIKRVCKPWWDAVYGSHATPAEPSAAAAEAPRSVKRTRKGKTTQRTTVHLEHCSVDDVTCSAHQTSSASL